MIKIKPDHGNRKVEISIENIANSTRQGVRQAFFYYGKDLVKTLNKNVLKKPKGGKVYLIRRGKTKRKHRSSSPNETAANISGAYRKTADFKLKGSDSMIFGAGSSKVPYAEFLEKGTRKMKPRPGLKIAITETERNAKNYIESQIKKYVYK